MARVSVRMEGLEDFRARVASLKMPAARPVYRRALRRNAGTLQDSTRDNQLEGQLLRYRTGDLWRSILTDESRLPWRVDIGSHLPQAGPLHFGWPAKGIRARPFLERSVRRELKVFPLEWNQELERQVRRARP